MGIIFAALARTCGLSFGVGAAAVFDPAVFEPGPKTQIEAWPRKQRFLINPLLQGSPKSFHPELPLTAGLRSSFLQIFESSTTIGKYFRAHSSGLTSLALGLELQSSSLTRKLKWRPGPGSNDSLSIRFFKKCQDHSILSYPLWLVSGAASSRFFNPPQLSESIFGALVQA